MNHSIGETSAGGAWGQEGTISTAVSTGTRLGESSGAAHVLGEINTNSLDRRRLEHELGGGGDHDVPYQFTLPLSMPQALAWMWLMGRVQRGEVEL